MRSPIVAAAVAILLSMQSGAATFSGVRRGGAAASGTLFNAPSQNIFDTYDPICDPATATANGITFCDGNEDGVWFPDLVACGDPPCNDCGTIECDYWQKAASPWVNDPQGSSYTECNSGSINDARANFGAAGTACTATMGYWSGSQGVNASHYIEANSDGTPKTVGTFHYFARFYFKAAGVTSERCGGGWPTCAAYSQAGPNGYKMIEGEHVRQWGGINAGVLGTVVPSNRVTWGGSCVQGVSLDHNISTFDHNAHKDEWIFVEIEVKETTDGIFKLWMDACGRDGRGCTGTPTLRASHTGNFANTCTPQSSGAKIRSLWLNFWNSSSTGEIQWDEFVTRDGEVSSTPIGFAPIH